MNPIIRTIFSALVLLQLIKCFQFHRLPHITFPIECKLHDNDNDIVPVLDDLTSTDISYISIQTATKHTATPFEPIKHSQEKANNQCDDSTMSADELSESQFGSIFTQCAPYIAQHRGTVIVIHLPGKLMQPANREVFDSIMDDLSILHLLGIQLVLVAGVRDLLQDRIQNDPTITASYHNGMRITDDRTMQLLKELSGYVRYEIESSLGRGFKGSASLLGVQVISGNFFYSAKPVGVRNGVDYKLTGEVRKIETDNFRRRLDSGDIVLLTSLGHSYSGEVFNVPSELLAAECAAKLKASKIIYLTDGERIFDTRNGKSIQSLRLGQAISLLEALGMKGIISSPTELELESEANTSETVNSTCVNASAIHDDQAHNDSINSELVSTHSISNASAINNSSNGFGLSGIKSFVHLIARCTLALSAGVRRAHLVPAVPGGLLKELYTRDGSGILIARDIYDGIRQAGPSDVRDVEEIIRPLELDGILVPRDRDRLEMDMPHCYLMTRDNTTLACGMVKKFGDKHAEISCMAVRPSYRREGRGETLLAYLERTAFNMGAEYVFVLSTRTMQWFEERGYILAEPALLPPSRKYNATRGSKVYMKKLGSQRHLDAEELLWNVQ